MHRFRFQRIPLSESSLLLGLAVAVGLATGVGVWVFREAFHFFEVLFLDQLAEGVIGHALESAGIDPRLSIVIVLGMVGLLVGGLMKVFVGYEKYHGVSGIMESVALLGGRLPYKKIPFKALASALSLGAGASVGPEDPSVQIGSNIGSFFGQWLGVSEERVRLLVAAGAASAIAAAFNAPIAGVFFALEVILGEFTTRSFSTVVLSAVIASAFIQAVDSGNPIFGSLEYTLGDPAQLPFYVVLGFGLALFSSVAIRFFHWQADFWHNHIRLPLPLETALTGVVVGLVGAFIFPQVLGPGEGFMHDVLTGHENLATELFIVLGIAKLIMTAISLGGGFVGGVFAPTLFMGITLGTAYGQLVGRLASVEVIGNPQAYAIAGMAGLMAGIVRAPITAILLVFELTDDYQLILPIMLTSVVCVFVVERIGPAGIYVLSLLKHGVRLQEGRDVDLMQGVLVEETMLQPAPSISFRATLSELRDALNDTNSRALPVVDDKGELAGIVTLSDLQRVYEQSIADPKVDVKQLAVGDILTPRVKTIAPDDVLWRAIRVMGTDDIGHLPVVSVSNQLVGLLRRQDIMDAYNLAIERKFQDQTLAKKIRLSTLTGAQVVEFKVKKDSAIADNLIREIDLPNQVVIASVERGNKLIVPEGNTLIKANDVVTVVADENVLPALRRLFD